MKLRLLTSIVLFLIVVPALPARAQHATIARGFQADRAYQIGDIDSINAFNGNLVVALPIGQSYTGSGRLQYGIGLVYNSKSWDFERRYYSGTDQYPEGDYTKAVPTKRSNAGMGWLVSLGRLIPPEDPINSGSMEAYIPFVYEGPDGGDHLFWPTLHPGEASDTNFHYTRNGSYLRLRTVSSSQREVHFPDGAVHTFVKGGNSYWITQIRDPWNNHVTISYLDSSGNTLSASSYANAATWRLTQRDAGSVTVLRTHNIRFAARSPLNAPSNYNRQVSEIELATFSGTTAKYIFSYTDTQLEYSCSGDYRGTQTSGTPPPTVPLLSSVSIPDGAGGAAGSTWNFTYQTTNSDGAVNSCASGALRSVKLPTLGRIDYWYRSYQLPTIACISPLYDVDQPVEKPLSFTPGVRLRKTIDAAGADLGVWTYSQSKADSTYEYWCGDHYAWIPSESVTTIDLPDKSRTRHYFSVWPRDVHGQGHYKPRDFGLPYSRTKSAASSTGCDPSVGTSLCRSTEVYECTSNCTSGTPGHSLRISTFVRYEGDHDSTGVYLSHDLPQRRLAETRTVRHDDGDNWVNTRHSEFDGLGKYRQTTVTSSGYGVNPTTTSFKRYNVAAGTYNVNPVTWAKTTTFTPPPTADPWILHDYDESWIGDGTKAEKTEACFDATGYLTRTRVLKNTAASAGSITQSANDILTVFTRDTIGNTTKVERFGGDTINGVASGLTTGAICSVPIPAHNAHSLRTDHTYSNGALATSRQWNWASGTETAFTYLLVDRTIDQHTGAAAIERDYSGLATSYELDRLGRLTWVKPATGHDSWTELVYTRATGSTALARINVNHRPNSSPTGTALAQQEYQYESFGRLWRERRLLPSGSWSTKETKYDSLGRVLTVSEWDAVLSPTQLTSFTYDWAGRVTKQTPPDGSTHDILFTYTGSRLMNRLVKIATSAGVESPSTTTEEYDALGRLWRVTEPSGSSGANIPARYTYDAANRLTAVCGGSTCTQNRTFTYDGRGFLTSEVHPERSAWYPEYDAGGNANRRRTGPENGVFDMRYTFDRAGRLTQVREAGGSARVMKSFTYGTSGTSNGKLLTAVRNNYHDSPTNVQITETYAYDGRQGRVSARTIAASVGASATFSQSFTWNELGQPATTGYPACTTSPCSGAPGPARTVTNNYTRGYLSSVTGFTNTITYHANGMVNQIPHVNGMTVTRANDPNRMARPASIAASSGAGASWSSGTYTYDGAGNIKGIGSNFYYYDLVSRLVNGTAHYTSSLDHKRQTYNYDPYGNRLTATTFVDGVQQPGAISLSVNTATNQITSPATSYDDSGNQLNWGTRTHAWDGLDVMKSHYNGSKTLRFVYTADEERVATYDELLIRWTWRLRGLDNKVLREYRNQGGTWSWQKDWIHRGSSLLATDEPSIGVRHLALDHLGTPRLITSSTGAQVSLHNYYPFGVEATSETQDAEVMKFTGHERDTEFNGDVNSLDYMHARYYSPVMGRFLSVDPINSGKPGAPQTWNRYAYSINNPLKYLDPDGKCAVPAGLQEGQVGICLESFISRSRIGGIGFGDNRDFEMNNPEATFRTSLRMIVDPQSGRIIDSSHNKAGISEVGLFKPLFGVPGRTSVSGGIAPAGDGTHNLSLYITGQNGLSALNTFGTIGFLANLKIDPEGNVEALPTSRTKGFPSIEGYAYRIIEGQLVIQILFRKPEEDPSKLRAPMDQPLY